MDNIVNKMFNFKPNLQIMILYISILSYVSRVQAEGIVCFKCLTTITREEDADLLCSHFDGSSKFQVFCPTSTFCMKTTVVHKSRTSTVTVVERNCALQKYTSHTYNDADRQWHKKEEVIKTAYEDGCFIGEQRGAADPPEYCFCNFYLCNSSPPQIGIFKVYGIILAWMIIKLL